MKHCIVFWQANVSETLTCSAAYHSATLNLHLDVLPYMGSSDVLSHTAWIRPEGLADTSPNAEYDCFPPIFWLAAVSLRARRAASVHCSALEVQQCLSVFVEMKAVWVDQLSAPHL